jgi:hypothetical protein
MRRVKSFLIFPACPCFLSFQAYFAARYIHSKQPEIFRELVGDAAFFYSDVWYEVMRFFVGLERDPQKAESIIDAIYQTEDKKVDFNQALRLIFAFYLMVEARVSFKNRILSSTRLC